MTYHEDFIQCDYNQTEEEKKILNDIVKNAEGLKFALNVYKKQQSHFALLKIFSPCEPIGLSELLPLIEHHGLLGIDMETCRFVTDNDTIVYIHNLRVKCANTESNINDISEITKDHLIQSLERTKLGLIDSDAMSALVLNASFTWYDVMILRIYAKYFKQVKFLYGYSAITNALLMNPKIAQDLVKFFTVKFDCNDAELIEGAERELLQNLDSINNIIEDRIFKAYYVIIKATKRTNYKKFIKNQTIDKDVEDLHNQNYLSIKINSIELQDIPLPKPFMETFVYSTRFEAIHLCGAKIARGGIRWSDRHEDYRTEVLGLMKAQMTKNSIIIPSGSKGGFVVKDMRNKNSKYFSEEGIECYKMFLRALLDIADNIKDKTITKPKDVICYDDYSPYLVVAADKGTATFSDYANSVSKEYDFWLGDAFASGGSTGYDHKKMAITAKGGWISVMHLAEKIGIDVKNKKFTVVGIGDMSGDVFGNAMLLSKNIELIAAFNHKHIFIDPTPDTEKSYNERERLFKTPLSQWSDYDRTLISQGGGIFDRAGQKIKLNTAIKTALMIEEDLSELTPDQLISAILKAPVVLFWNGGIGTYVKASFERNESIGDKTNDSVRVNANELRCKIIGEGGNLGISQYGRIEYARCGGNLNTDFIDNSGGVDCSDHEVNIKIGFSPIISEGKVTIDERNKFLAQMQDEVGNLVLCDNKVQNLIISIEEKYAPQNIDQHSWLIQMLEQQGDLDRVVEMLPTGVEISRLKFDGLGLTRPEIAVLLAYAKNTMYKKLENIDFKSDEYFMQCLLHYFPRELRKTYSKYLKNHYLHNEIIRMFIVNDFVNIMGVAAFHEMSNSFNSSPLTIIKAFIIAKEGIGLGTDWRKIESMDSTKINFDIRISLLSALQKIIYQNIKWMLYNWKNELQQEIDTMSLIKKFKGYANALVDSIAIFNMDSIPTIFVVSSIAGSTNIPNEIAIEMRALPVLANTIEISLMSEEVNGDIVTTAQRYYDFYEQLGMSSIYQKLLSLVFNDYNEQLAKNLLLQEISLVIQKLIKKSLQAESNLFNVSDICNSISFEKYISYIKSISFDTVKNILAHLVIIKQYLCELVD